MGFVTIVIVFSILCLLLLLFMDLSKGKKEMSRGEGENSVPLRYSEGDLVDESFFIKKINHNDVNINNFNKFADGNEDELEATSLEKDVEIEKELEEMEQEHNHAMLLERINEVNSIAEKASEEEFLMRHLEEEGISFTPDDQDMDFGDDEIESDQKRDFIDPEDIKKFLKNNKGLLDYDD